MIIEMRTYRTTPEKRDEFLRLFRTKSLPAHLEIGIHSLIELRDSGESVKHLRFE